MSYPLVYWPIVKINKHFSDYPITFNSLVQCMRHKVTINTKLTQSMRKPLSYTTKGNYNNQITTPNSMRITLR